MNEYIEKLNSAVKKKTIVYVDAANLERSVQDMFVRPDDIPDDLKHISANDLHWSVDYKKFKEFFKTIGEHQGIRFYSAEFSSDSHQKFRYFLKKGLGFKLITKPLKEYDDHTPEIPHRKANFDVEIAVDSTFSMNNFETLILFSGDCDFEYLIKFLKGNGKVIIGFSRSGHVAKELPPALSHYFDIANFRSIFLKIVPKDKEAKSPASFDAGLRS
ncbi:MAG: hypothetical protein US45_C0018G0007 [Candidatus Nomurabacteria bacterium GW2011_GWA1_37_20]|uniref:NYN domain-containing protein n=2 Tax=Parcubacteria group TaxID=1794811 RepID=A0A0G0KEG3_9BACT|nr:MAG: hypothetical protein US33_C0016G0007 [Parcubacteria group bacterium GW2011_GWC1_36_9]KKQ32528.1 MAG: hypothetical protein US45_C0018G0007 [Candidatus Nomurabacteria bacterium GW2011_GWA1_37_20]KKQ47559.1 MAG: hypothetical protein US65_C0008G0018 [Candidatus Yanofskybacteria bacterium GW2011_GWC2_37_9]